MSTLTTILFMALMMGIGLLIGYLIAPLLFALNIFWPVTIALILITVVAIARKMRKS